MTLVEENSLVHKLNQGAFGKFRTAIEGLDFDWKDFTLPKIVVVGTESAGKSSLIENITKCAVFPRNRDICTKVPVHFELKTGSTVAVEVQHQEKKVQLDNRAEICRQIQSFFDQMGDRVDEQHITVRITAPDAPTLTLIDLPGIRTYPAELAARTRALAERHLVEPDTLVICVVQATDRLTGNNAVALTTQKLKDDSKTRAILVLTKPDLVADSEWPEKVVARLQGSSAELRGIEFATCVSVVSRPQNPDGSEFLLLANVDLAESDWWPKKVPTPLLEKVGVQNLMAVVDGVFASYIERVWKPHALTKLRARKQQLTVQLLALGPDPTTLTPQQVRSDVTSRLGLSYEAWQFHFERLAVQPLNESGWSWNWVAVSTKQRKETKDWSEKLLASPKLEQDIRGIIAKAFDDGTVLKTKRFDKMREQLVSVAVENFTQERLAAVGQVNGLVDSCLLQLSCKERQSLADLQAIERGVLRIVNTLLYDAVWVTSSATVPLSLEECTEVKEQRSALTMSISQTIRALQTIQQI